MIIDLFTYIKKIKGLGYSRNYGVSLSKGKYITMLDSDDLIRKRVSKKS